MSPDGRIKVSDLVVEELVRAGVGHIFGVTGGAVVHLFDSASRHPEIEPVFLNHEQSAAFAVGSYAKIRRGLGAGFFTTGPGGTNALTGVAAAWLDSVPSVFISGQVRSTQTIRGRRLRQIGTQEIDIIEMVRPVTKYAVTVLATGEVRPVLQRAIEIALEGRPGPVWIDLPVDVTWSSIDSKEDSAVWSPKASSAYPPYRRMTPRSSATEVVELLREARRPVFVIGNGVVLAHSEKATIELLEQHQIPFVTTWLAADVVPFNHPLHLGRAGIAGQRGANLAVQNCDFLVALGTHLNSSITGTRPEMFAREAKIAVVDIDPVELDNLTLSSALRIESDVEAFVNELGELLGLGSPLSAPIAPWRQHTKIYGPHNRISEASYFSGSEPLNSYALLDTLSDCAGTDDIFVVDGGGTVVYAAYQSIRNREGQRIVLSTGICAMGSGLPEAIGASLGSGESRVICLCGDGSLPFNVQELQTIRSRSLDIKLVVLNNGGYLSIRTTQDDYLEGHHVGSSESSGLALMDVQKLAVAFDLPYVRLDRAENSTAAIKHLLDLEGPAICEVILDPAQEIVPRQAFQKLANGTFVPRPLEDMHPLLDRATFAELMLVPQWNGESRRVGGTERGFLRLLPKSERPVSERMRRKAGASDAIRVPQPLNNEDAISDILLLREARNFAQSYFDGDRLSGYGGYRHVPGYWSRVAAAVISQYGLDARASVLEVGCAKGFLMHELMVQLPGLRVVGIDISDYAIENAISDARPHIRQGDATDLPFDDSEFDAVVSFNTLSELSLTGCKSALREIERVSRRHSYVSVNAWFTEEQRIWFDDWNVSALTNLPVPVWLGLFSEVGYSGDYDWFILDAEEGVIQ